MRDDLRDVVMGEEDGYHPEWVYRSLLVGPLHEATQRLDRLLDSSLLPPDFVHEMRSAWRVGPAILVSSWRGPDPTSGLMMEMIGSDGPVDHTGDGLAATIAVYRRERSGAPIIVAALTYGNGQRVVECAAFDTAWAAVSLLRSTLASSI